MNIRCVLQRNQA